MITTKQFWLADAKNVNQYGWTTDVELIDGPHNNILGVAEAKRIITGIGLDRGKNRNYVMICIESVPEIQVVVNEEAIGQVKGMMDSLTDKKE